MWRQENTEMSIIYLEAVGKKKQNKKNSLKQETLTRK